MRRLVLALVALSYCAIIFGAITSYIDDVHTSRPQEIRFDSDAELQGVKKGERQRRDASYPLYNFSSMTPLSGDNNGFALVHYSGANSSTIFILTQRSVGSRVVSFNLWRTTDYGRVYNNETNKLPWDAIVNYYFISLNADKLILTDQKNNRLYRTEDRGESYRTFQLSFDPSRLMFHPTQEDALLGFDSEHSELYISIDFGQVWMQIGVNVTRYTWDTYYTDTIVVFYEATHSSGATYLYTAVTGADGLPVEKVFDVNLGAIEKNSLSLTNEYIFVEVQLNSSDTDGAGGLFVSYKRQPFSKAVFPLKSEEQHYLIVDASEGQALVAVYHYDNLTNLYVSDETGQRYSLSLQNLKGSGLRTWQRHQATVELVRVAGVRGTFIANRLDPSSNTFYWYWSTYTQISYDKGATWRYILRPAYRADGRRNGNCTLSECYLNLRISQPSRQGVYSKSNALGLIAAHGNSGKYLNGYWWGRWFSNVYLSRDGGFSWTEEFNSGAYEYSFLDHGGVVVTVSKYSGYSVYTKSVRYSCTEGLTWETEDIAQRSLYVIGMLTEPGSTTLEATVFAKTPGRFVEWLIVQLNFSVLINTTCQPDDYTDWIPSDERQGGLCLLGEKTVYERRKPEVCCYNGRGYQRLVNTSQCPCRFQDFDCDFGYEKLSTDSPCTPSDGTIPQGAPLLCPEGSSYTASLGYRLIPGDKCEGGDYHAYAPRTYQCPVRAPTTLVLTPHKMFYQVGEQVKVSLSQGFGSKISTQYLWEFGDGHSMLLTGYDTSQSVTHSYTEAGIYTVMLSAYNSAGVNNVSVIISVLEVVRSFSLVGFTNMTTVMASASYSIRAFSPTDTEHPLPSDAYNSTWRLRLSGDTIVTVTGAHFSYVFSTEGTYSLNVEVQNAVSTQLSHTYSVAVIGIPSSLSLNLTTHPSLLKTDQDISFRFSQGSEQDYTTYTVSYGDDTSSDGLSYTQAEFNTHQYSAPGKYTAQVTALNLAGSSSVSADVTILDEISNVRFSSPHIIIVGLNEVFEGSYSLKYSSTFSGAIGYVWTFGHQVSPSSSDSSITKKFFTAGSVGLTLTVRNQVSSQEVTGVIEVHPTSDNVHIVQDGQSFEVNSSVTLSLEALDDVALPTDGVKYRWSVGGNKLPDTTLPSVTFLSTTLGTKLVKAYSVSSSDGTVVNHVVTGTIHVISFLSSAVSSYMTGTTAESTAVVFTLSDRSGGPYEGQLSVQITDSTENQWDYSGQTFNVTSGYFRLILSPLTKYTIYKIKVTLGNPLSRVNAVLKVSRVREVEQSVQVTLEWVGIPEGVSPEQWQSQLESGIADQIGDRFKIDSWRVIVDVSVVENEPYQVQVKLLPSNMTTEGVTDVTDSLQEIGQYYSSKTSISLPNIADPLPVISVQINDGSVSSKNQYAVVGVAVGVPVLLLLSLVVMIPLIVCSVVYVRKYRRVSHAYTRLRQTRANNFTFTQDGLEDDDDEAPVLLKGADPGVKFSLEENFEQKGFGNETSEKDSDL